MKRLSKFVGIAANYFLAKIGLEVRKIRIFSGTEKRLLRIVRYLTIEASFKRYLDISKSQFGQDLLVLRLLHGLGSKGFFVEFGAVDGLTNSNSFLLEKELGWKGIVSEPARRWHAALKANRTCSIDTRCVYSSTGEKLMFGETGSWRGGNTLVKHANDGGNERKFSAQYQVETVSFNDLLRHHNAPSRINFLSVDTEGSEFEILKNVDFSQWSFDLVLVEYNYDDVKRSNIFDLFIQNGYARLELNDQVTGVDDWYASSEMVKEFHMLSQAVS